MELLGAFIDAVMQHQLKQVAQKIASSDYQSGIMSFGSGVTIAFAKGATESEARRIIERLANNPLGTIGIK